MIRKTLAIFALVAGLGGGAHAQTQGPSLASTPRVDYANPDSWLCRPGRPNACTVDLDATVIRADGSTSVDTFHADPNAPIDCFYVYPTVSTDPGVNATMAIEHEETLAVQQQFARLASKCRLFAPVYRQHTLTALVAGMTGHPMAEGDAYQIAYRDVVDAWKAYLANDNHGRGVVLVGHSQGSGHLMRLIAQEIDGKPVQKQLVSAILMGDDLLVPPGKDVGGSFKHIPLCRSAEQTGCAIAFESFRATSPPPADSLFGQGDKKTGMLSACVNPAALDGGSGLLKAYLPTHGVVFPLAATVQPVWTNPPKEISTPFVELPGLMSAQCVSNEHGSYLAVSFHGAPSDRRTGDIQGDVLIGGKPQANWGLHLVDANITIGNLVDVVGEETKAYLAAERK